MGYYFFYGPSLLVYDLVWIVYGFLCLYTDLYIFVMVDTSHYKDHYLISKDEHRISAGEGGGRGLKALENFFNLSLGLSPLKGILRG